MRTWAGLFLSGHNKGVLSVSRGRSPGRKRREVVAWVLCWETAGSFFFGSALCDSVRTSCRNRAYCWNQEGILNAHEKRIQMHTCHQDVASRRVWVLVGAVVMAVGGTWVHPSGRRVLFPAGSCPEKLLCGLKFSSLLARLEGHAPLRHPVEKVRTWRLHP